MVLCSFVLLSLCSEMWSLLKSFLDLVSSCFEALSGWPQGSLSSYLFLTPKAVILTTLLLISRFFTMVGGAGAFPGPVSSERLFQLAPGQGFVFLPQNVLTCTHTLISCSSPRAAPSSPVLGYTARTPAALAPPASQPWELPRPRLGTAGSERPYGSPHLFPCSQGFCLGPGDNWCP